MDLWTTENELAAQGYELICGVDEAGRGPLAGPVFAAAVILPRGLVIPGLNDSKKLSPKKRGALFDIITSGAVAYGVASVDAEEIDRINILEATLLAMRRAVEGLSVLPSFILIDGNACPKGLPVPAQAIIGGDAHVASIAAASILAKVSRDRLMLRVHETYPDYGFDRHKGYGTALHCEALRRLGPCPIHRRSFIKKIVGPQGGR